MSTKGILGIIIAFVVLILLFGSMYTIRQGEAGLVLRLGELVKNPKTGKVDVMQPGLHFKIPFVENVREFNVRLRNLEAESSRIPTKEQKYLLVDYYAKWKIADLPLYYKRTGGFSDRAKVLLQQKINDALRAAFGVRLLQDVVSGERSTIMQLLKKSTLASAKGLGIRVVDVRIKGIDLLPQVQDSVFKRMSTKREQVATEYRYQGRAQAEKIMANADATARVLVATSKTQAQETKASGDAEAAAIYNATYSKDPKFYALYRSLEAYREVFKNKDTVMVLKPNSEFFRYFNQAARSEKK